MSDMPLVSVVVTTKNEAANIERCLQSTLLQTYPNKEIIVVDNFSTDDTVTIAKRYAGIVAQKGPERSAQRNYGMKELASGRYVMYVDADMILSPTLLAHSVEAMKTPGVAALHLRELVLGVKFFSRVRRFERCFYDGTVIDGARFFDREKFIACGGFDEATFAYGSGEDWDMDKAIRRHGRIDLCAPREANPPTAWPLAGFIQDRLPEYDPSYVGVYHNESEFELWRYLRKKAYYASAFDRYIAKYGVGDEDIKRQLGMKYRLLGVFVENGKWVRLLRHPLLSAGMYFLRFWVGMSYLFAKYSAKRPATT